MTTYCVYPNPTPVFFYDYDESALLTVNTQSVDLISNDEDFEAILEKIGNIRSGRHYFNQSSFAL